MAAALSVRYWLARADGSPAVQILEQDHGTRPSPGERFDYHTTEGSIRCRVGPADWSNAEIANPEPLFAGLGGIVCDVLLEEVLEGDEGARP